MKRDMVDFSFFTINIFCPQFCTINNIDVNSQLWNKWQQAQKPEYQIHLWLYCSPEDGQNMIKVLPQNSGTRSPVTILKSFNAGLLMIIFTNMLHIIYDYQSCEKSRIWRKYPCKKLEGWGKKSRRIHSFAKSSIFCVNLSN